MKRRYASMASLNFSLMPPDGRGKGRSPLPVLGPIRSTRPRCGWLHTEGTAWQARKTLSLTAVLLGFTRMTGHRRMSIADATDRAVYRYWTTEKIRFNDLDALGHLNNCAFAVYCESARVEVLTAARGQELGGGRTIDWVIVNLNIDFRAQGHYPGLCEIGTRVLRIGNKSVTLGNGLFVGDTCIATATATVVLSDLKAGKALPLPEDIRAYFEDLRTTPTDAPAENQA